MRVYQGALNLDGIEASQSRSCWWDAGERKECTKVEATISGKISNCSYLETRFSQTKNIHRE
jgi:hypothetical protein